MSRSRFNTQAMALTALAMTTLASNDAILKHLGALMPMGEAITLRGAILCLIFAAVVWIGKSPLRVSALANRWCVLRGACELFATYAFLTSLTLVPIALATTLAFTTPLMLTALSVPLFKEHVGVWRWSAVAVGFVGVVLITYRTGADWQPALLLPLIAALGIVGRDIATRFAPTDIKPIELALTTSVTITLGGLLSLPWGWHPLRRHRALWALAAAILIGITYFAYVKAVRIGDMSAIAPMQYVAVIWATIFGVVFWSEVPDQRAFIGGLLIIAAGLVLVWRERLHGRRISQLTMIDTLSFALNSRLG